VLWSLVQKHSQSKVPKISFPSVSVQIEFDDQEFYPVGCGYSFQAGEKVKQCYLLHPATLQSIAQPYGM
jgi:hypothetical protein